MKEGRSACLSRALPRRKGCAKLRSAAVRSCLLSNVHLSGGAPRLTGIQTLRHSRSVPQAVIHAPQQRYRRFWRPSISSIVGEAPSRATKPTTVVRYIIIIPVQASDPFAVALLERFGECGFRCFVACAVTRNDPDRAYTPN